MLPIRLGLSVRSPIRRPGSPRRRGALHRARPIVACEPRRVRRDAHGPVRRTERARLRHVLAGLDQQGARLGGHLRRRLRAARPGPGKGTLRIRCSSFPARPVTGAAAASTRSRCPSTTFSPARSLDSFTTYLIVVPSSVSAQKPLRFGFVVPVGASPALSTDGSPAVPPATLAEIYAVAGAEARWQKIPVTIDLYGQALLALGAKPGQHTKLVGHGLLRWPRQPRRRTLQCRRPDPAGPLRPRRRPGRPDRRAATWCSTTCCASTTSRDRSTSPPGPSALTRPRRARRRRHRRHRRPPGQPPVRLRRSAFHRAVAVHAVRPVPDRGLQPSKACRPTRAWRHISSESAKPSLCGLSSCSPTSPRSTSTRLTSRCARGVALVAPESWAPQPQFLSAVLKGLSSSPIVTTVPISQLFATVQRGTCQVPPAVVTGCSAAVRALASPSLNGSDSVTANQVRDGARTARGTVVGHSRPTRRRSTTSATRSCWQRPPG